MNSLCSRASLKHRGIRSRNDTEFSGKPPPTAIHSLGISAPPSVATLPRSLARSPLRLTAEKRQTLEREGPKTSGSYGGEVTKSRQSGILSC